MALASDPLSATRETKPLLDPQTSQGGNPSRGDRRLSRRQSQRVIDISKDTGFFARSDILTAETPEELPNRQRLLDDSTYYCRLAAVTFLVLALTAALIVVVVMVYASSTGNTAFYYASYVGIFGFIALLFLLVDFCDSFESFQRFFEKFMYFFFLSFVVFAFVDYILIQLKADLAAFNTVAMTYTVDVLFYVAVFLMFCTWMALWKTFRFYCTEQPWVHAFIYLTVIGYIIVKIARWLRPHPDGGNGMDSWHCNHHLKVILPKIVVVQFVMFLVIVVLGRIGIAAFAQFSLGASTLGVEVSLFLFCCLSMVIMLTPLMPGSIVDACGGFVFAQVLVVNAGLSIWAAWGIALVSVICLHFIGACTQWWIGSWRAVQIWGNSNMPVELLAASDAVLRTAGFIKVGLVGFIFMDTANGLNQGRINMEFCTQFWSEYANIPNGFALVSLGASIAADGISQYSNLSSFTAVAIPMLLLLATFVQAFGVTIGAKAMGDSVDKEEYWTAREKWTMMHFFRADGYTPTEEGWENDVFSLGSTSHTDMTQPLFDVIAPIHAQYLETRDSTSDPDEKIKIFDMYRSDLNKARDNHYADFHALREEFTERQWLIYEQPLEQREGLFTVDKLDASANLKRGYTFLVVLVTVAFWGSIYEFYNAVTTTQAVQKGLAALGGGVITPFGWSMAGLFILLVMFIWSMEIMNSLSSFGVSMLFVLTGCKTNPLMETRFETPSFKGQTSKPV